MRRNLVRCGARHTVSLCVHEGRRPLYRFTLSLKYLISRRLNVICVLGVALGVMLLILVLSVMDGFQNQLKETLRGSLSDIILTPNPEFGLEIDFEKLEVALLDREPAVTHLSPQLLDFAIVMSTEKSVKAGAQLIGIDAAKESAVSRFNEYLRARDTGILTVADEDHPFRPVDPELREMHPGVVLGRGLARNLRVWPGMQVYLLTAIQKEDPETGESKLMPRERQFVVTGLYESGNGEFDGHVAYVDRNAARDFTGGRRELAEVRVKLRSFKEAEEVRTRIEASDFELFCLCAKDRDLVAKLNETVERAREAAREAGETFRIRDVFRSGPFFYVETWRDRRANFLAAIENEKRIMAVILFFIVLVSGFMIVAMLSMLVVQKTRDIGIIKALGGTTRGVLSIFMWNGLVMGIVGSLVGLGLGLLVTANVNAVEALVSKMLGRSVFPQSIYLFSEIPTQTDPVAILVIVVVAIVCSWLAALYPAFRASRMDPVEALRHE
jgi:lipoprotein-releasing system permease protein